jgi:hypothetical protein
LQRLQSERQQSVMPARKIFGYVEDPETPHLTTDEAQV